MADNTKGVTQTFIAHSSGAITHPNSIFGTVINCADEISIQLILKHGFVQATANTNPGFFVVKVAVEGADDDQLGELTRFRTIESTPSLANIAGTEAIGQTNIAVGVGEESGFVAGAACYVRDTGTEDNSEWHYVDVTASNIIHITRGLVRAKDSADDIFSDAQIFSPVIQLDGIKRIVVDFVHQGTTGADVVVEATGVFLEAFE